MTWRTALVATALSLAMSTATLAQSQSSGPMRPDLDPFIPEAGEQIPADLSVVDDEGNPVNIREVVSRSPYTVLTLGCLT